MFSFLKRKNATADGLEAYEEIAEKKTTSAGYLLLLVMGIFIIIVGQTIFSDLRQIPTLQVTPAYCTGDFIENYKSLQNAYQCSFSNIDREFGIEEQINRMLPSLQKIAKLNSEINDLIYRNSEIKRQIEHTQTEYDVSLQEKMAKEEVLYNRSGLQQSITTLRNTISANTETLSTLDSQLQAEIAVVEPSIIPLKTAYLQAQDSFDSANAWYRIKVFCLMLLFVLPIFIFATRWYLSLKKRNSPYTIIAMAVMGSFAILFLQVVLVFLYDIIPHTWIEKIFKIFQSTPILRYVLYYGTVFVVVALFGGIVYLIQRRIFDSRKTAIRRLKDSKCPICSFSINQFEDYCPKCGTTLKETCPHCNNKRIVLLPFCPICGKTKQKTTPPTPTS